MIQFTFNTPIKIDTGESVSELILIMEEYRVQQDINSLSGVAKLSWYRSIEDAIDRFRAVWPIDVPRILRNINTTLTAAQFANLDLDTTYNVLMNIMLQGDGHSQWQQKWGAWDGFEGLDPLNTGVKQMPTVPDAAPTTLVATANGTSQIDLTWAEAASNEFGFVIYRTLVSEDVNPLEVGRVGYNQTSFTDTNLSPGTQYFYKVAGWNWAGIGTLSLEASATTDAL